jgi:RNA polymerase sigma-70 factor (ECF subfamily)
LLQLRRNRRRPEVSLSEHAHDRGEEPAPEPEQKLYRAIGQLEEVDRMIIMLVLEDVSYPEIAEMMGISENNLRVKIHRARTKLKTLMQHGE